MKKMMMVLVMMMIGLSVYAQDAIFYDYKTKAERGDGNAQAWVSCAYFFGNWGVTKNPSAAYSWALKSDMSHDEFGEYMLGLCYYCAVGTNSDFYKAASQFEKSYQHRRSGGAGAAYYLAYCYYNGLGKTKDVNQALYYFEKAVESGELAENVAVDARNRIREIRGSNPQPTNQLATINFLSPTSSSSTSYNLQAGIKSSSRITNVSVSVNRGINSVNNDGYDFMLNKTVTLNPGNNTITVSVTNGAGTTSNSLNVYVSGGNNYTTSTEKRVALVIGNANYNNSPLQNPVNDATDIAAKLQVLGFDVTLKTNLTNSGFETALKDFKYKANNSDIALLYYAGHGMEIDGKNYLIPIDAPINDNDQLKYKSVNANFALDMIAGAKKKIIILDACRNNPTRGIMDGGLGVMSAPNAFIAYSTSPGKTAPDGTGRNSPYTSALLDALNYKNFSLAQVFQKVSQIVMRNNKYQIPWTSSSLAEDVILNK